MKFNKTVQVFQKLGASVVKKGRDILKKEKRQTKANTLYKDFDYLVKSDNDSVRVTWTFGKAEDYWEFLDQGVRGSSPSDIKKRPKFFKDPQKSEYSFKGENIAQGVVLKWIADKPLRLRNTATGRFIEKTQSNLKSAAYLIGRAIALRGISRTLFFSAPYEKELKKYDPLIDQAFSDDLELIIDIKLNE